MLTDPRRRSFGSRASPGRGAHLDPGRERQGASVVGWAAGLNLVGAGPYLVVGTDTIDEAMQMAAIAMRTTGKPVGLLMWRGRHAWVMSGFHATARPSSRRRPGHRGDRRGPPLPARSSVWGASPAPGTALSVKALGRQFVPRRSSSFNPGLAGKYVLVIPHQFTFRTQV